MPKIKVEHPSPHSPKVTFDKIRNLLESDRDLRKMDASYKCNFNEQNLTGTAKGSKFEAAMTIREASGGAHVEIEVNLPLLLTPVKGVVQSTLQKKVASALA